MGTNWRSGGGTDDSQFCKCNACAHRVGQPAEKIAEWLRTGKANLVCEKRCGGTRVAGDALTMCKKRGKITICNGCYAVIGVVWVIDAQERARLQRDEGHTIESLIALNKEMAARMAVALQ